MIDHVVRAVMTTRLVILKQVAIIKKGPYSRYLGILLFWLFLGIFRDKTAIIVANKENIIDNDADVGTQS